MNQIKWPFLLLAITATISMMAIGISIGYRNITATLISVATLIIVMGFGFMLKKKSV